jgi:hypothetical protein
MPVEEMSVDRTAVYKMSADVMPFYINTVEEMMYESYL